jgi:hypothetical protein
MPGGSEMPYKYVAMWNLPGCLPEMEPAEFDNAVDAFDFMADSLIDVHNAEYEFDTGTIAYSNAAYECETKAQSGVIGEPDWQWHAPNGYVYSVECVDKEDE